MVRVSNVLAPKSEIGQVTSGLLSPQVTSGLLSPQVTSGLLSPQVTSGLLSPVLYSLFFILAN
jgi:hypothetical protein